MATWLRWSASTMACSRPPPPTTRTFMVAMPRRRPSGFLLSRTGDEHSNSFRRLHELEEVPLRIFEGHDAAPRIVADLAEELHPLFPESLDVGSDVRGLQRQDRALRGGLALRRIEPHPEAADGHRAPVVALFGDR